MQTVAGDGVAGRKRRRRDLSSDDVRNLATASGRGRLKENLESTTWQRHLDYKATTRTVAPTPSSVIVQIPIPNNFFIKGTHMQMIRDNQFDGRIRSDPYRHIADFLEINNLFQYGKNQEEAVKLRTFPFLLSGEANTWLNELDEGIITSWNEMR
ncbi:hypothetical protein Tco_1405917 [Tanacetum coccineum]